MFMGRIKKRSVLSKMVHLCDTIHMMTRPEMNPLLRNLPTIATRRIALHITRDAARNLRGGHPWLFADSIVRQSHEGKPGDLAVIFNQKRRFLAIGLYDPTSPIRVRILHQGKPTEIDRQWFAQRLAAAAALRVPLRNDARTTGYRLLYGENDGLPGLVVDCYDTTMVMKIYTLAWVPYLAELATLLQEIQPYLRLIIRLSRNVANLPEQLYGISDGTVAVGPPVDDPIIFLENGLRFDADPIHGQKTGFFLDQRENRALVETLCASMTGSKRVLNVFAYSGGFSLYAARGGAREVTSLDLSRPALEAATCNFARNQDHPNVRAAEHHLLAGDAFPLLSQLADAGDRYDLVIIDPPAFAKRQSEVDRALGAYAQLTRLGLAVLQPGGTLVLASCSSRVSTDAFVANACNAATQVQRPLQIFRQTTHALDHPIGFPEGAYLKCLFATA